MPKAEKEEGLGWVVPLSTDKGIWTASLMSCYSVSGAKTRRKN